MVAPVWEDTLLDFFVQTGLHAVHVLEFISGDALVLAAFASSDGFLERARAVGVEASSASSLPAIRFCHLIKRFLLILILRNFRISMIN